MVRNQKELTKRHAEAFVRRNVQKREYMETTGRFLHVCANCECEESAEWLSMHRPLQLIRRLS
jgi:hypothetical protein